MESKMETEKLPGSLYHRETSRDFRPIADKIKARKQGLQTELNTDGIISLQVLVCAINISFNEKQKNVLRFIHINRRAA